jgi:hypothetical protein
MTPLLRLLIVLLLVALVPARAIGSVTIAVCSQGQPDSHQHDAVPAAHADHEHEHHGETAPADSGHACGYCAEHCAGVAFAVPMEPDRLDVSAAPERTPFGGRLAPGFLPDLLDRPPLAS